jgi:penicillin-binding protein 2
MACSLFFVVVIGRLYYLQIAKGGYYRLFSNENTLKEIKIPATRGIIYDRNKFPLVSNRPSYDLTITPQYINDFSQTKEVLTYFADIDEAYLDKRWAETKKLPPFFPVVVARDIPYDTVARIKSYQALGHNPGDRFDLSGIEVESKPLRRYNQADLLSNTIGYIREVSAKELTRLQEEQPGRYRMGDTVGASGLEKEWDPFVKGRDGFVQKVVDAVGREITSDDVTEFLRQEKAVHGNNMFLTIDSRLQKMAEERFRHQKGGLVVLDINTGAIIAFVSRPQFNPSDLVSNVSADIWNNLTQNPDKPLLNRAYQAAYPPGSTYKIVTALAGLAEGVVDIEEKIHCPGYYRFGKGIFRCWKHSGHGAMNLHDAIVRSCDVFFYTLGIRLGVDRLAKYAHHFGLGQKTGLRLSGEQQGLIPTEAWKLEARGKPWQQGETVSVAIGQGYNLVTPLQNAVMVAAVANGGQAVQPYFIESFEDARGGTFLPPPLKPKQNSPVNISPDHINFVRNALVDVVNSPWGTAQGSRLPHVLYGGKTGTSQVISAQGKIKARMRGVTRNLEDHAWFVAFAESEQPKIAISVLVEHGGHGGAAAAPIARDVIAEYYRLAELDKSKETAFFLGDVFHSETQDPHEETVAFKSVQAYQEPGEEWGPQEGNVLLNLLILGME